MVGIRQTSSAVEHQDRLAGRRSSRRRATASRTTSTKTAVSESSRTLSATSLGVFWRSEPSTRAIIRSTNEWPGSEVIRTTIRSESTTVPPVTAHRSPPDSRMTGADSPVTADSSTVATPSMTSPSPGMRSPASTTTTSPARRLALGTSSTGSVGRSPVSRARSAAPRDASRRRRPAGASRRLAACALPRPSATASARVPKSTVSHSQTRDGHGRTASGRARRHGGDHRADLDDQEHRVCRAARGGSSLASARPEGRRSRSSS